MLLQVRPHGNGKHCIHLNNPFFHFGMGHAHVHHPHRPADFFNRPVIDVKGGGVEATGDRVQQGQRPDTQRGAPADEGTRAGMRLLIVVILTDPAQQQEQDQGDGEEKEVGGRYVIDVRQPRRDVPNSPERDGGHQQHPAPDGRDQRLPHPIERDVELHLTVPHTATHSNITWVETPVRQRLTPSCKSLIIPLSTPCRSGGTGRRTRFRV